MKLKKISFALLVAATALTTSVSAQNEAKNQTSSDFKFSGGDMNLEIQMASPFAAGEPFSLDGVKFRYFLSNTSAFRLNVNVNASSNTDITQQEDADIDELELKDKTADFEFKIAPGYEIHFSGTNKLSPYVGGDVVLNFARNSVKEDLQVVKDVKYTKTSDGSFTFGLNGVAGFDYYFAKSLYIGAELNYGLNMTSEFAEKTTYDVDSESDSEIKKGGSFSFAPAAMGKFKLGFIF